MQVNLQSPYDFRANSAILGVFQEYLAATIGEYRAHVRAPSQPLPRSISERMGSRVSSLRTRWSDAAATSSGQGSGGAGQAASPKLVGSVADKDVIDGENGFTFHHAAFLASFSTQIGRTFAAELLKTQLWQVGCFMTLAPMDLRSAAGMPVCAQCRC